MNKLFSSSIWWLFFRFLFFLYSREEQQSDHEQMNWRVQRGTSIEDAIFRWKRSGWSRRHCCRGWGGNRCFRLWPGRRSSETIRGIGNRFHWEEHSMDVPCQRKRSLIAEFASVIVLIQWPNHDATQAQISRVIHLRRTKRSRRRSTRGGSLLSLWDSSCHRIRPIVLQEYSMSDCKHTVLEHRDRRHWSNCRDAIFDRSIMHVHRSIAERWNYLLQNMLTFRPLLYVGQLKQKRINFHLSFQWVRSLVT